jgi:GH43 family beta-xylosidase
MEYEYNPEHIARLIQMVHVQEDKYVYRNPVVPQRADPWIYKHTDGYYYFTASVPEYDRIELRRSATIQGLGKAEPAVIWRKRESGILSSHIWAPEVHYIDGKWYVYFAAARTGANGEGVFDHRMYALECGAEDPLEGEWTEMGQIKTAWESFALDATTFEHRGLRYYVWAQRDPSIPGNSNLYISEMANPWTLKGPQVMLTKPELPWEIIGFLVNEGPAVIKRNGNIYITYSASATDYNYCMGILSAPDTADPLDASAWTKSPEPVFTTNETTGQYGPGHNSFTVSEDDRVDLIVYHARNYKDIVGDPLYDPNRHTRVQPFTWNEDGTPNFGIPVPDASFHFNRLKTAE